MRFALNHQDVRAALLRQMISDTRSDNAAADDDDVRGFHATAKVRMWERKVKRLVNQKRSRQNSDLDQLSLCLSFNLVDQLRHQVTSSPALIMKSRVSPKSA